MKLTKSIACAGLSLLMATAAIADANNEAEVRVPGDKSFSFWGQSGEWRIFVDNERNTCMVEKFDSNGNAVQIGLGPKGKRAYLGIFTKLPEDLRGQGENQIVKVEYNDTVFEGRIKRAQRQAYTEYSGVYLPAKDMDIAALATDGKQSLIFPDQTLEVDFTMAGAVEAVAAAKECHADVNS